MKTYRFPGEVTTAHDAAEELGVWRQTIIKWLNRFEIPHTVLTQGKKQAATFFSTKYMPKLREQAALAPKPNRLRSKRENRRIIRERKAG